MYESPKFDIVVLLNEDVLTGSSIFDGGNNSTPDQEL